MKTRVLIVDDEPLARERLRQLLEQEPDIEIVGQCASGKEALAVVQQTPPDLIFLDIQMPEMDGFEVLSRLDPGRMPAVVFVTAYDRFALQAFEVHAVDYLLKPFDRTRFEKALRRALERIKQGQSRDLTQQLSSLLGQLHSPGGKSERLAIKTSGRVLFIKLDDIDWVEAADNYVNLHIGQESCLHRDTLTSLETQLPASKFLRISRSVIVNLDRIKELQPLFHGEYSVILRNGTRLTLSRGYRDKLDLLMGRLN